MLKHTIIAFLAAVLTICLCSCSKGETQGVSGKTEAPSGVSQSVSLQTVPFEVSEDDSKTEKDNSGKKENSANKETTTAPDKSQKDKSDKSEKEKTDKSEKEKTDLSKDDSSASDETEKSGGYMTPIIPLP